jgi:hypothetical protein
MKSPRDFVSNSLILFELETFVHSRHTEVYVTGSGLIRRRRNGFEVRKATTFIFETVDHSIRKSKKVYFA